MAELWGPLLTTPYRVSPETTRGGFSTHRHELKGLGCNP
jgi:hypothetical protein